MVLPTDIKKANQSKVDGHKIETGSQKHRAFNRADTSRKNVVASGANDNQRPEVSREKSKTSKSGAKDADSSKRSASTVSKSSCQSVKSVDVKKSWQCSKEPPAEERQRPFLLPKCYFELPKAKRSCTKIPNWQHCEYVRDECGSGIVPKRFGLKNSHPRWCKTPLSMYQATIGELGRQLLCGETVITRDINPEPPCNIHEYIMPACAGYYRRYDCIKPCEEDHIKIKDGKKIYRDRVERYWNPCVGKHDKVRIDVNDFAPHNSVLAEKYRRSNIDGDENIPCW